MSIVAVAFVIEHALTIRKERLMPEAALDQLEDLIARGDLQAAVQFCEDPRHYSLATDVVLAGLERYQTSEFGFADYKSAVEEAGEDHTARLYRKTDGLNIIGVIAPMLGLFGTVEGMMESFNIIASTEGSSGEGARAAVEALCAEIKVGSIYEGKVVSTKEFGAFVEIAPETDGLCHVSELSDKYVQNVFDIVNVGDHVVPGAMGWCGPPSIIGGM